MLGENGNQLKFELILKPAAPPKKNGSGVVVAGIIIAAILIMLILSVSAQPSPYSRYGPPQQQWSGQNQYPRQDPDAGGAAPPAPPVRLAPLAPIVPLVPLGR